MNWANTEHHRFKDHAAEAIIYSRRVVIALLVVVTLFGVLIARFHSLQVVHHDTYITLSDRNRIQVQPLPPNRGLIFDRNGELIADNRPNFTLSIIREHVKDLPALIEQLSALIEISVEDKENFYKYMRQRRRPFEPVPLRFTLTDKEIALLAINKYALEGATVDAQLVRHYPYAELFAHVVGYVSRINEKELSEFDEESLKRYEGTHSVGKIGLERYYESTLLGSVGYEYIEANAHGRRLRVIEEEQPVAGKNLQLFIDLAIQQAAYDAFNGQRGALVALDVNTGGVLAMVSTPSFNPNLFVTGISVKNYRALNESTDLPLFNRAIQGQYPPGSTLKPMLGLGGLHTQTITSQSKVWDPGFYQLENDERLYREWKKGGHGGFVNLHKAIVESCDIFFYDLSVRMGVDRMHDFGQNFALGERTQLDIPSERDGIWPSREWKKRVRGQSWYPGNSLNMGIGQGDVLTTPLQLAVMAATLANKGTHIRPRLAASIDGVPTERVEMPKMVIEENHWEQIQQAMRDVVHSRSGTAAPLGRQLTYEMGGKTGTAQVVGIAQGEKYDSDALAERHRDHTLFVGYAPAKNPEIALAVIVENGEKHSNTTFPVITAVFDSYFASKAKTPFAAPITTSPVVQPSAIQPIAVEATP